MTEWGMRLSSTIGLLFILISCYYFNQLIYLIIIFSGYRVLLESIQMCEINSALVFVLGMLVMTALLYLLIEHQRVWLVSVIFQNMLICVYLWRWPKLSFYYPMLWMWAWVFASMIWSLQSFGTVQLLFKMIMGVAIIDISAYIIGRNFGQHRIFPSLSPKKSYEGFFGSCVFIGVYIYFVFMLHWILVPIISLIVAAGAILGDVFISSIKRTYKVKDTGSLIPGHGGIMDRMDGYMLVLPWMPLIHVCL